MAKIISVASHKGGVGKTTTALNLGFSLSRLGQKVLLVDTDPQGAMAIASNLKKRTKRGLINLMKKNAKIDEVLIRTKDKSMGVLGTGVQEPEDMFFFERETRKGALGKIIQAVSNEFDYVVLDAPAGFGVIVTALLSVSTSVLVPITCRTITVKTLPPFLKMIRKIRTKVNPELLLEGIVVTMADNHEISIDVFEEIRKTFPAEVLFETIIPYDESFEFAGAKSIPVGMLTDGKEAAQAYMSLAIELKTREMASHNKGKSDEDEGLF